MPAITKFDLVLKEVPDTNGLTKTDVMDLYDMLKENEAYPIEIMNPEHESSAMGFITPTAADSLEYDYTDISSEIGNILADMNLENETGIYNIKNLDIYLSR